MRRSLAPPFLVAAVLLAAACGSHLPGDDPGDDGDDGDDCQGCGGGLDAGTVGGGGTGATPGGVKDLHLARDLIANGKVPPPDALLVEAMFAEHDLGLEGEPCTTMLCLRTGLGIAPDGLGQPRSWVQVGLSSGVDPATWERPPTTFVLTVDVSGSMGWEYLAGDPSPGHLARELLHALTPHLTARDRVALVTYGTDVAVPLPLRRGDAHAALTAAIDALTTAGSTNMEAGVKKAYEIGAAAAADGETEDVRIVLFTDEQPNVGATEPGAFEGMVDQGAKHGVGMSVLALGLGIGPEVLRSMAHLRGANAFSLLDLEDVETFMADEYPWFVTPIAYDLRLSVSTPAGFRVDQKYGFPSGEGPVGLEVASVFLSKRKGALLFSVLSESDAFDGLNVGLSFSYHDRAGTTVNAPLAAAYAGEPLDARGQFFSQGSVARTTALALLVSGMHLAAERYATDPDGAQIIMQKVHGRFAADAAAIADPTLDREVALARAMLDLIVARAPQGTFYP